MLAFLVTWALVPLCLANSFVYEDPLAYPRFMVELSDKTLPESAVFEATQTVDEEAHSLHYDQSSVHGQQISGLLQRPELKPSEKENPIIMTSTHGQPFVCTISNISIAKQLDVNRFYTNNGR